MEKLIYFFGDGQADGQGDQKELLGGKGAALAGMVRAGVPVPPGFTICTDVCRSFLAEGKVPAEVDEGMAEYIRGMEKVTGTVFGSAENPLLVSVRSGAAFSMPGMMDTILNLGLNDETVEGLAKRSQNPRFAYDCYRRFLQMFGNVVMGIAKELFEKELNAVKADRGAANDTELDAAAWKDAIRKYRDVVQRAAGRAFPQDPWTQLREARDAVFQSWNNDRAVKYRHLQGIPAHLGTAVNVQAMVFGNLGDRSATGVGFTRNPSTGEHAFYGEYLLNAQGEDVVAGIRTPKPIMEMEKDLPEAYATLREITTKLEQHYRDVQDFEFTIQDGTLYMLQTRSGKRTGPAAVRIAVEMVAEGILTPEEALERVEPAQLDQLLHPVFDPKAIEKAEELGRGLPASPGAASGRIVFTAEQAVEEAEKGGRVVLVRAETCPDDIHGMAVSQGVLTGRGGMTSHAAVVGRQMGKPSVVGCEAARIDEEEGSLRLGGKTLRAGDPVSLDGSTGIVYNGDVPTSPSEVVRVSRGEMAAEASATYRNFHTLLGWADEVRRLRVRANADVPRDAQQAVAFGAQGIGLCRTEHMFFAEDRLPIVQEMILARTEEARRSALDRLLPHQESDFRGLFEAMEGLPVTIRTLDPPLHEFLPKREDLMADVAVHEAMGGGVGDLGEKKALLARVEELHEFNPMLGHRGCRLGIVYPEITEMQARAILRAACAVKKAGKKVDPEIMIPLVGDVKELEHQKKVVDRVAAEEMQRAGVQVAYLVGTMIEVPRAALTAGQVAKVAAFFSFGTNDLTQMTFGFSRDDAGKFLRVYAAEEYGILPGDPFVSIDEEGVGRLVRMACEEGRAANPDLHVGICGEHGGDPKSVAFCHRVGLDYVSCSPFRVPVARLAAARAVLAERK